jgi:hypothetical protein
VVIGTIVINAIEQQIAEYRTAESRSQSRPFAVVLRLDTKIAIKRASRSKALSFMIRTSLFVNLRFQPEAALRMA